MSDPLSWPSTPPSQGAVRLETVTERDVPMAMELSRDPYVSQVGSLPRDADETEARAWVARQQARLAEGAGYSFALVDTSTGRSVGHCGLWLKELEEGRAAAGYSVAPSARGRGLATDALIALTEFGWSVPRLFRIALHIEPWNVASIRTAERAGYEREGLLRSFQSIAGERRDMLLFAAARDRRRGPACLPW